MLRLLLRGKKVKRSWVLLIVGVVGMSLLVSAFWIDQPLEDWLGQFSLPPLLNRSLEFLGRGSLEGAFFLLWLLAGWVERREKWIKSGAAGLIGLIGTGLVVRLLKVLVGRPRPRMHLGGLAFLGPSLAADYNSFPSGHSATAFFFAHFMARWTPGVEPFWYVLAGLISLDRLVEQAHFASDALAGALIGVLVAAYAIHILGRPNTHGLKSYFGEGRPH